MNILYNLLFAAVSLFLMTAAVYANERVNTDQLLKDATVSYVIEHDDGVEENVIVKYEAYVASRVWQTGSSSKPLEGKIEDDRKCNYTVNARVYRRAYILSHSGVQAPIESYQAVYQAQHSDDRGPDNFFEALTRHVTCGDVNNFSDRIAAAKSDLISQFDDLISEDDDKNRENLKRLLLASKITKVQ